MMVGMLILATSIVAQTVRTTTLKQTSVASDPAPTLAGGNFGMILPNFTGVAGAMTPAQFVTRFSATMHTPDTWRNMITAGTDLRLLNPNGMYMKHLNTRTLFNEDTSHPDDDYIHANHPEWVIKDRNGNPVPIFVAGEESLDFGNSAFLTWMLNTWVPTEYVDSTDADPNRLTFYMHDNGNFKAQSIDCGPGNPICDQYTTDVGVQTAWKAMLDAWRSRWPNKKMIISGGPNTFEPVATQMAYLTDVLSHADGFFTEGLTDRHSYYEGSPGSAKRLALLTTLQLADWLAANGKYYFGDLPAPDTTVNTQSDINYNYAFFNLFRNGTRQFYGHVTKDGSNLWQPANYAEMDLPLGAPLENRVEISANVFRRRFANATAYVNLSDSSVNITLTDPINKNSLGTTITSPMSLASFNGITVYHQ